MYDDLPTPAVVIELDAMENNIRALVERAGKYGIAHRPHIKTHRSTELARLQLSMGARGITCAKLGEAEVMAEKGIKDIFICYPIIGEDKLSRLGRLLPKARISTLINSVEGAEGLSHLGAAVGIGIPVLIDLDGGLKRGGLQPGKPALDFAVKVGKLPGIHIEGLMYYDGLIYGQKDMEGFRQAALRERDALKSTAALLDAAGFRMRVLSGGTSFSGKLPQYLDGITEIRSGHYIFNDCGQLFSGFAREEDCALRVVASVVSLPDDCHAILDAGTKALTSDLCGRHKGFGYVVSRPDWTLTALNEEHGFLESPGPHKLKIGEKLAIIPNHACVVCNLTDNAWGLRDGRLDHLIAIDARGRSV